MYRQVMIVVAMGMLIYSVSFSQTLPADSPPSVARGLT
jgi:hypothetical protein